MGRVRWPVLGLRGIPPFVASIGPDVVRRLVIVASAYRLGTRGKELQADMTRLIRAGEPRQAWAQSMTAMLPSQLRGLMRPLSRLVVGSAVPDNPTDLLITLEAVDAFDVAADLPQVTAPTLVIGGAKDAFYSRELFEGTAAASRTGGRTFSKTGDTPALSAPARLRT